MRARTGSQSSRCEAARPAKPSRRELAGGIAQCLCGPSGGAPDLCALPPGELEGIGLARRDLRYPVEQGVDAFPEIAETRDAPKLALGIRAERFVPDELDPPGQAAVRAPQRGDVRVDRSPHQGVAELVLAARPGSLDAACMLEVYVDRHALRAEFEVPRGLHVLRHALVAPAVIREEAVLPHQRLHLRDRVAHGNHETGV